MKVIRRIFGDINSKAKKTQIENALNVQKDWGYFNHDLDEQSEEYANIKKLVGSLNLDDSVIGTEFTRQEIESAKALVFNGAVAIGYPQPEEPKTIGNNTYLNSCFECGAHDKQIAPFQIKNTKLGKHKIMSLNWIFDELFVEYDFYERFFKKLGFEMLEPLLYKANTPIKTIVQLIIPKADFMFDMQETEFSVCPVCNRKKYSPKNNGFFPKPRDLNFHMVKTNEFFGSGHSAFSKIVVSNELMTNLLKSGLLKYHQFVPAKM